MGIKENKHLTPERLSFYKMIEDYVDKIFPKDTLYTLMILEPSNNVHCCSNVPHDEQEKFLRCILDSYVERDQSNDRSTPVSDIGKKFS